MKTNRPIRKTSRFSQARWASYALAAGATALAGPPTAEAEIHYSGQVNYKFDKTSRGSETHSFPLSQGIVLVGSRYVRGAVDNSATLRIDGPAVSSAFRNPDYFTSTSASALPREAVISHGRFNGFGLGGLQDYDCEFRDWQGPGTFYAGFRFNTGAGVQYGWVRIKWGGCSYNGYIVKDYAWGDPGDQIKAGQRKLREAETPVAPQAAQRAEAAPVAASLGSLGLLALGGVGLQARREARRAGE